MPGLTTMIALFAGGSVLAAAPAFLLRKRERWRSSIPSLTLLVGTSGAIAGHLLLDGTLGTLAGLAVLGPAVAISAPLLRAQIRAQIPPPALPPGESESSVERALRQSERTDALEGWRRAVLKSGVPLLLLGAATSVMVGSWAPFLVIAAGVVVGEAALLPIYAWKREALLSDGRTGPVNRLPAGDGHEDTASGSEAHLERPPGGGEETADAP